MTDVVMVSFYFKRDFVTLTALLPYIERERCEVAKPAGTERITEASRDMKYVETVMGINIRN